MNFNLQYKLRCPNPHHPVEDAVYAEGTAIAAFDGVTLLHQDPYPIPSPAAEAATNGAKAAVRYVLSHIGEPSFMFKGFKAASDAIKDVNEKHDITSETVDFLNVQYAAAVGALAVFASNTLYYAQINDCGVLVCRPDGEIIDNLITDKTNVGEYLGYIRKERGFVAGSPEEHVFIRGQVVNNPNVFFNGSPLDDYVLTGEILGVRGVHWRQREVTEPFKVIVYSDGFIPFLASNSFRCDILNIDNESVAREYVQRSRIQTQEFSEASLVIGSIN